MPSTSQTMPLSVIVERREIDNPWQRHRWSVVGVVLGAREIDAPQVLRAQPGWVQYHAATLPVTLHSGETEGYKRNLANAAPVAYVLLRPDDDAGVGDGGDDPPRPFLVAVCPYEAKDYLDAGDMDESVESVPMPDGARALSSGTDATLRLWDLETLQQIRLLVGHDDPVFDIAFAPDGATALSAGRDGYVIRWDLATGEPIRAIQAHEAPVWSVAFTPDGRFAVSASSDEKVRVWHLATGDQIGVEDDVSAEPQPWLESSHPGAKLYRKCVRCHALSADGPRRSGPHFAGLFSRRAGSVAGYNYSDALHDLDFAWSPDTLRALFRDGPDAYIPGTKMPMQRIADDAQLGALIEYLREITAPAEDGDDSAIAGD